MWGELNGCMNKLGSGPMLPNVNIMRDRSG